MDFFLLMYSSHKSMPARERHCYEIHHTTLILKRSYMNTFEQRLQAYLEEQHIQAEHLSLDQPRHSGAEAAYAVNTSPEESVKNIYLLDSDGQLITATVKGEDRMSVSRIAKVLQREGLRLATPAEILGKSGYPYRRQEIFI